MPYFKHHQVVALTLSCCGAPDQPLAAGQQQQQPHQQQPGPAVQTLSRQQLEAAVHSLPPDVAHGFGTVLGSLSGSKVRWNEARMFFWQSLGQLVAAS